MKASDFLNHYDYQRIMDAIRGEKDFEYVRDKSRLQVRIHSSQAACDFPGCAIMSGDYIVGYSFERRYGDYQGIGFTHSIPECMAACSSYPDSLAFIQSGLRRIGENVEIGTVDRQKSLF